MTSQLLHLLPDYTHLNQVFQLFDLFPTVPMSLLLCVHINMVFLLLYLHFAIGLLEKSDLDVVAIELDTVSSTLGQELLSLYHHDHLDSIRAQNLQDDQLRLRRFSEIGRSTTTPPGVILLLV